MCAPLPLRGGAGGGVSKSDAGRSFTPPLTPPRQGEGNPSSTLHGWRYLIRGTSPPQRASRSAPRRMASIRLLVSRSLTAMRRARRPRLPPSAVASRRKRPWRRHACKTAAASGPFSARLQRKVAAPPAPRALRARAVLRAALHASAGSRCSAARSTGGPRAPSRRPPVPRGSPPRAASPSGSRRRCGEDRSGRRRASRSAHRP